jgi:hypothetical protein
MDVPRIRQVSPRGAQRHHLPLGRGPERAHPFSSRVSGTHAGAAWNDSMRTMLAGRAVQPSHRVAPRVMGRRSAHSDLQGYTVPHCTRGISTFSPTLSEGFPVGSVRRRRRGTAGPAQGNRPPEGAGASGRLPRPPSTVENPVPSAGRNPVNSAGWNKGSNYNMMLSAPSATTGEFPAPYCALAFRARPGEVVSP